MKRSLVPLIVLLATSARAAVADGAGRDLSVALFSTRAVRAVTLTPLGPDSWTAGCAQCRHTLLTAPLRVSTSELFAGGPLRITDDATGDSRTATGLWHLRRSAAEYDIVLTLPSEHYVAAVINAEAAPNEPPESLRALAVVVRTYALNGTHYSAAPGHLPADLCDSTQCQAVRLGQTSPAIEAAVEATTGETLWFGSRRAQAFFSQSCGGLTEDAATVWPALTGTPYLRSHPDPYCLRRDPAAWHAEVSLSQFAAIAHAEGWRIPANIASVRVAQRSASHRAMRILFMGADGTSASLAAGSLRLGIGRALGWDRIRSDAYDLVLRNGSLIFDGRGHGHGVGLCQSGAAQMATEGHSSRDILAFYFPGATVRITSGDRGWQSSHIGPIEVRSTIPLATAQTSAIAQAWTEAQRRFPPSRPIAPHIVFAPTTELFRQMTAQPGWVLASARVDRIVLQPDAVLRSNHVALSPLLLHEMLHVLVESECTSRAPLWLREGLVEALAAPLPPVAPAMPVADLDAALQHAASLPAAQQAHHAAAARVHLLIQRYGFAVVRGWLKSDVPSGVD